MAEPPELLEAAATLLVVHDLCTEVAVRRSLYLAWLRTTAPHYVV